MIDKDHVNGGTMQEFEFKMTDDGGYCVISYKGDEENVVIPPMYLGKPVTILFDKIFRGHGEIKTVSIPDTVTDIGEFVFDGCSQLRSITLPAALTGIWPYAFARCGIEQITIPEGVQTIASFTFKDCKILKRAEFLGRMKKVRDYAFCGCRKDLELIGCEGAEIGNDLFGDTL